MSKNMKIWKPGQLVTIDNKVYRVVRRRFGCAGCENIHTDTIHLPCVVCLDHKGPLYTAPSWFLKELKPNK